MSYNYPLFNVHELIAGYGGIRVLHSVNISVDRGEPTALVGVNGSGKTTLLRVISGLLHQVSGSIEFLGKSLDGVPAEKRVAFGICLVPESREIFANQSVQANLRLGAYSWLSSSKMDLYKEKLDFVFSVFPILENRRKQNAGTLSGGEQQMLAISRALMAQPKLMLLDEPSTGLAPLIVREIFRVLKELNKTLDLTLFLVEQNTRLALKIVKKGYLIERGRIMFSDSAESLLEYVNKVGFTHSAVGNK